MASDMIGHHFPGPVTYSNEVLAQLIARMHATLPVWPEVVMTTVNSLSNYLYLEKYPS